MSNEEFGPNFVPSLAQKARADQQAAKTRDAVDWLPESLDCPGDAVVHRLEQHTSRVTLELLLGLAIGELAANGTDDTTIEGIST
jgi:hypothetical protein